MDETTENEPSGATVVRQFRPHWRVLLAVGAWGVLAIAGMIAAPVYLDGPLMWTAVIAALAGWVFVSSRDLVGYFSTKYTLTTEQIIVQHGVLKITKVKIPLESIDNVTSTRNVMERLLGYGDLVIESTQGSSVFADIPDPEEFEAAVIEHRNLRRGQPSGPAIRSVPEQRDAVQRLADLADLHDRGALSDAEFEQKKARLLDEI